MNQWLNNLMFEKIKNIFEAKPFQIWGQAKFWSQANICLGPTFGQKLKPGNSEARPNERDQTMFYRSPDYGTTKLRRAHSCPKSHFYTFFFYYQQSETWIKSELVYVLWPGAWTSSLPTWDKNITFEQNIGYYRLTSSEEQCIDNQWKTIRNFKVILYLNLMTSTLFFTICCWQHNQ